MRQNSLLNTTAVYHDFVQHDCIREQTVKILMEF
jgi:hypothetical protein